VPLRVSEVLLDTPDLLIALGVIQVEVEVLHLVPEEPLVV
jgi:hypothetical protein